MKNQQTKKTKINKQTSDLRVHALHRPHVAERQALQRQLLALLGEIEAGVQVLKVHPDPVHLQLADSQLLAVQPHLNYKKCVMYYG